MKELIKRNLEGKKILSIFLLTGIVYTIMLAVTIPKVMDYAGGMKVLDMMPTGYDVAYVFVLFEALGDAGRHAYLYNQLPLDLIFPLLSGISFCLIIAWILKKFNKLDSNWFYLCFLPVFAGLFDYLENFGIITMLITYPDITLGLIKTTNVFSVLKSALTTMQFVVLIILLIVFGYYKLFPKMAQIK
jgi:hypothetical protein